MFDFHADLGVAGAGVPASAAVLGRRRFGLRPVHGRAAPGRLPAQDVEERRHAAGPRADHDAGLGGPAADRGARARQTVRDRSVLARDRLQPGARRRGRIRSDLGARPLPAARGCADHQAREDRGGHGSVGQPGSQERREHREQPHAEHDVPLLQHHGRDRPGGLLARPERRRLREGRRPAGRDGDLDRGSLGCALLRRPTR